MTASNLISGTGGNPASTSTSATTVPDSTSASDGSRSTSNPHVEFYPSSKIKLLHQRTSLSLAYDHHRDDGGRWGYQGETAMYVIVAPSTSSATTQGGGGGDSDTTTTTAGSSGKVVDSDSATNTTKKDKNSNTDPLSSSGTNNGADDATPLNIGDYQKSIELALHLRDGCCHVESVEIFAAGASSSSLATSSSFSDAMQQSERVEISSKSASKHELSKSTSHKSTTTPQHHQLRPLPQHTATYSHHDPLSIFMTSPSSSSDTKAGVVSEEVNNGKDILSANIASGDGKPQQTHVDGTNKDVLLPLPQQQQQPRRRHYEADAHSTRSAKGMTYSLRAASISSALGELRITIAPTTTTAATTTAATTDLTFPPFSQEMAHQCWKNDLLVDGGGGGAAAMGETPPGTMERKMNNHMYRHRCRSRREARLELVASSLAEATTLTTTSTNDTTTSSSEMNWPLSRAMKIVIRFSMVYNSTTTTLSSRSNNIRRHYGGITFVAPPTANDVINYSSTSSSPSLSTPHVYTNCGTHGDHQGVRSWLPTLDSASPKHRASHELIIKVTSRREEGLWPCASGEDFGCNRSVSHPILYPLEKDEEEEENVFEQMKLEMQRRTDETDDEEMLLDLTTTGVQEAERAWMSVENGITHALGYRHATFIKQFFHGSSNSGSVVTNADIASSSSYPTPPTELNCSEILAQKICRNLRPNYVTSMFSSLTWLPCPSRSLGFAIGPFATLYDPEYFRFSSDEDDDDDDEDDDEEEDSRGETQMTSKERGVSDANHGETMPSSSSRHHSLDLHETAVKLGEGIRQLYFALRGDRRWIHEDVTDEFIFGKYDEVLAQFGAGRLLPQNKETQRRPMLSAVQQEERLLLESCILASTIGVPNRALSLMRDVLALPAYRTSSYTQIWIPNAHMSGDSCGGNMVGCPEVGGCNAFLGGAILDSTLLPPPGMRLPFYDGGRCLQFLQARNAVRGWIRAALPLGSNDDVGQGYLHALVEAFLMSLYERGHGAFGEGGGKGSYFYTKRYAIGSGLNSPNLDFLPLVNIEDDELAGGVAVDETKHLWRCVGLNGTETHTSSLDEFVLGQLLAKDFIEALERNDVKPSMGWLGSQQSATFLSHHSASSTALGCGALDFVHPMGGQMYRAIKSILLERVYEGRAGLANVTRVVRAAFIASFLRDAGVSQLNLLEHETGKSQGQDPPSSRPLFAVCIDEIMKKQAISHEMFTRSLRVMAGPIHEAYLRGNLIDIDRGNKSNSTERKVVASEGFPNSYVRGASGLYLRVGAHVEAADGSSVQSTSVASQSAVAVKGIQLHVVAEPVIPIGGSAFGGPVTLRVIENEGQCREFIKTIPEDGSRTEWGPIFLHARPVSTPKQQQASSGISEAPAASATSQTGDTVEGGNNASGTAFTSDHLHRGGFQALELIRITNLTPLLWIRVDPHGIYNGRIHIFQQDACLAEQLFHDGDAAGQVEAIRALAERPFKIQGLPKITNVHDVPIAELPVRVLGDCLRGSVALHCDLPHNPAVRAQAAFAIAQWQNNKAPESRDVVGGSAWLGLDLLLQYFRERYYCNGCVLPVNFRRLVLHKNIAGGASGGETNSDGGYQYLDALTEIDERRNAIDFADEVEIEEDEEYRVRSACVTAIASIRAQDNMTPKAAVMFLEEVLLSGDKAAVGSLLLPKEDEQLKKKQDQALDDEVPQGRRIIGPNDDDVSNLPYVSLSLVADALLALCYVHVRPQSDFDAAAGCMANPDLDHPISSLMGLCLGWLEWDLERLRVRARTCRANSTGAGSACYSCVAPCAITALCQMSILKQCTMPAQRGSSSSTATVDEPACAKRKPESELNKTATAQFYIDIFDDDLVKGDSIRAAAAQAAACICCASDRDDGLLVSFEFMLDRILDPMTSPGLRLTLASLMIDACNGRICSLQRVASFCGQRRLCESGTRLMNGPLGASYGGDNGSALLLTVSDATYPAANAVNDGARRGLRLLRDCCVDELDTAERVKARSTNDTTATTRVSKFATKLWRTINGELVGHNQPTSDTMDFGVCAHDTHLRCALVALWQWIFPRRLLLTRSLPASEIPPHFSAELSHIMKATAEQEEAAISEDEALKPLIKVVEAEIDRQKWRGDIAKEAFENVMSTKENGNLTDVGQPLPLVKRDEAWKLGGWVASTAQQRRKKLADGGIGVTKIRLMVKSSSTGGLAN